mgnify:CR=1 FL=1
MVNLRLLKDKRKQEQSHILIKITKILKIVVKELL